MKAKIADTLIGVPSGVGKKKYGCKLHANSEDPKRMFQTDLAGL